jgi:hypothetical protein
MLARRISICVGLAATVASCSFAQPDEPVAQTHSAILAGRPSGDDENANVYIENVGAAATLRCSGRIIAPGLVVSARHCVVQRKTVARLCTSDGAPVDLSDTTDLTPVPPSQITVYVGSNKAALRAVAVREVITQLEVTICHSDMAFLVLAQPGLDVRTPLRREPVKLGEELAVTGWGYTSDDTTSLPAIRYTRDQLPVTEVGPGFIPAGTFAIAGNTVCYGDSGAAAVIDGAVAGVYSRLDGSTACSLVQTRNIFAGIWAEEQLVKSAYAAIGEEPWYAPEGAGAPCTSDDQCASALCDATSKTCAAPCGDGGLACPAGRRCSGAGTCISSGGEPAAPSPSCSAARLVHGAEDRSSWGPAALLVCCLLHRRRSRRRGGSAALHFMPGQSMRAH